MIRYMPNLESILWAMKSQECFDTIDDLKSFVADQRTRFYHFIGQDKSFCPDDVEFHRNRDVLFGWENYHHVVVDGITIGFCGE